MISQQELSETWDSLSNEATYRVVDEDGVNMANAQIRLLAGGEWIYVDDVDGYRVISGDDAARLTLEYAGGGQKVTARHVRELLESRAADPVLVRWKHINNFHTAGDLEVVPMDIVRMYGGAFAADIIVMRTDLAEVDNLDLDNPTDEDCAALAEWLND